MTANATVTIPYNELQEINEARQKAEIKVSNLMEQLRQNEIRNSDPNVLALANAALDVVRYAVSSLPPESNKGWPFVALRTIAAELPQMPDAVPDHTEFAQTLIIFAKECEAHERRRAMQTRLPTDAIGRPIPVDANAHE